MKPERKAMNKRMIKMMMVLGIGGMVMFASGSQAMSLNLSFCNGGISLRLDDDKHEVRHDKHSKKQVVHHGKKENDKRGKVFREEKHKVVINKKDKKHDKRR